MPDTIVIPPVTLVIPNFNGAGLLQINLPSVLRAMAAYPGDATLIVVDDASHDDSVALMEQAFPDVTLIRNPKNLGFAEAVHAGVRAAGTELLIFLNSDVRPDENFIQPLLRHFDAPDVFSVSPLVVNPAGQPMDESWRCYTMRRGRLRMVPWAARVPGEAVPTLFASGGSMALRKSMFLGLGGFLPIFRPFYSEDSDLGLRAWRRGWRNLLEPSCRIIHDHQGSSINTHVPSARVRRVRRRNQLMLEWIHVPGRDILCALLPAYGVQVLGRLLRLDMAYLAGFAAALLRIREVLEIRRSVECSSDRGFWEIMALIRASMPGQEMPGCRWSVPPRT